MTAWMHRCRPRRRRIAALVAGALLLGTGCTSSDGTGASVVAAVYPLAFIAEELGGGDISVETLTPAGAEPHDLELTPSQARSIAEADLVLYVGAGFQPAVEDAVKQSGNGLDVLELVRASGSEEHTEEEQDAEAEEEHGHTGGDPHVWLDPSHASLIAAEIASRLEELAPEAGRDIARRATELEARFDELGAAFEDSLASCEEDTIVVSHEAFGYLTRRYSLEQVGISGIDPEQEPSPQRLAEVARFVDENDIRVIYLERIASPEVGETLAKETGVDIAYLDPLEMAPEDGDLFDVMASNLDALESGLRCGPGL